MSHRRRTMSRQETSTGGVLWRRPGTSRCPPGGQAASTLGGGLPLHMVQPGNNNNGGSDMDSLEDMLRKVTGHYFFFIFVHSSVSLYSSFQLVNFKFCQYCLRRSGDQPDRSSCTNFMSMTTFVGLKYRVDNKTWFLLIVFWK